MKIQIRLALDEWGRQRTASYKLVDVFHTEVFFVIQGELPHDSIRFPSLFVRVDGS